MSEQNDRVNEPEQELPQEENGEPSVEEQLRIELDQAKDRTLRALADLENYRARAARQSVEERKYAHMDFIRELLPVCDNVGRALDAVDQSHNLDSLVEGVQLIYQQLLDLLTRFHCEKIDALHQPFDPNVHESIALMPSEEFAANTVITETQTGFKLYDRVVRPSKVVLSSGKTE